MCHIVINELLEERPLMYSFLFCMDVYKYTVLGVYKDRYKKKIIWYDSNSSYLII